MPGSAMAWGPVGHRLVAAVAYRSLSPKAKAEAGKLLEPGLSLADVASYADAYRDQCPNTASWHFVDIPLEAAGYDAARDCNEAKGSCVLAALDREIAILRDRTQTPADRELALKLIVHFIGDLHQPLHAADHQDRGGNDVKILIEGKPSNLHALWDTGLPGGKGLSEENYAGFLLGSASRAEKRAMQQGTITDWALQAHAVAKDVAYGLLGTEPSTTKTIALQGDYSNKAMRSVDGQLLRAGLRLASVLNDALLRPGPKVSPALVAAHQFCKK
jgi:hypothetical protein